MEDLISREEAIRRYCADECRCDPEGCNGSEDCSCVRLLKSLPSAQPEIIRCRDCEHWDKTWTNDWSPDYHYCPMIDGVRKGDFYCADAERRTE